MDKKLQTGSRVSLGKQPATWEVRFEVLFAGLSGRKGGLVVLWTLACVLRGLTKS